MEGEKTGDGSLALCRAFAMSLHCSGDTVLVETSSETSCGWITGMHFARVIFSPSHSEKPADCGKAHSKVLRLSGSSCQGGCRRGTGSAALRHRKDLYFGLVFVVHSERVR